MRATLRDTAQQETLERLGFVVVPFFDEESMEELSLVHERLGEAPDDPRMALFFSFHSQSREYNMAVADALHPIVRRRTETLFADHEPTLATFITKWPGPNGGFGPHQDPTIVDERSFRGVNCWIPLVETGIRDGRDNGMVYVVPGSHRFEKNMRVPNINESVFSELDDAIMRHGVGAPVKLGEAIVFDNRVIHYSMPNETETPRVAVVIAMRPREATCVLCLDDGSGSIAMYAVPDDTLTPVPVYMQPGWKPRGEPIARFDSGEAVTPEEFEQMCASVGLGSETELASPPSASSSIHPGSFCAFCGSSEGLSDSDRIGRSKAQLLCSRCEVERESAYAGGS